MTASKYGKAESVSKEDQAWLTDLDSKIWNRSKDRLGGTHVFVANDRPLQKSEFDTVIRMILHYRLPCVMGSGPYGELSMGVFNHHDLAGERPDFLIALSADHFKQALGIECTWNDEFSLLSEFTHSKENKKVLSFYGFSEPKTKDYYEY